MFCVAAVVTDFPYLALRLVWNNARVTVFLWTGGHRLHYQVSCACLPAATPPVPLQTLISAIFSRAWHG